MMYKTPTPSTSRKLLSGGGEIIPGFNGVCNVETCIVVNNASICTKTHDQAAWEMDSYGLIWCIVVVYLFLGIAIICDEQFTSSLESICNPRTGLGLSPDVAGATFMAAGSSAPELASSFMGTFVSKSDVGLGTIIGSAVFNILIIIGATAIVVGEPIQLDWKPLGRDVCFYCGSVVLLIGFVAGDQEVVWYEALLLLVYYGLYILWMVFNTGLMRKIAKIVGAKEEVESHSRRTSRRTTFSSGLWHADHKETNEHPPRYEADISAPPAAATTEGSPAGSGNGLGDDAVYPLPNCPLPGVPSMGEDLEMQVIDLSSKPNFGTGTGGGADSAIELPNTPTMGSVATPAGDAAKPATEPAAAAPALLDMEKGVENVVEEKGGDNEEEDDGGVPGMICNVLSFPYIILYGYSMPDCHYEDPDDEGADEEIEALKEQGGQDAAIANLEKQKELRAAIEEAEEAEEDDKVVTLQKELFVLYEPLSLGQRLYVVTFTMSLVWITILSYFMVTMMEKIGCAWGISSFIMGITFLAMGTSVPDALGSISVAKDGEGDMAVSNAIGSNVFDICIGLGVPWFIVTIIDGKGKAVTAALESIIASTVILFLVVIVLFFCLYLSKHPETQRPFCLYPSVGYILFGCYGMFVVFQIVWTAAGLPE